MAVALRMKFYFTKRISVATISCQDLLVLISTVTCDTDCACFLICGFSGRDLLISTGSCSLNRVMQLLS